MPTDTEFKIQAVRDTCESIGILVGSLAMVIRYAPKVYNDVKYLTHMLKAETIVVNVEQNDPDFEVYEF